MRPRQSEQRAARADQSGQWGRRRCAHSRASPTRQDALPPHPARPLSSSGLATAFERSTISSRTFICPAPHSSCSWPRSPDTSSRWPRIARRSPSDIASTRTVTRWRSSDAASSGNTIGTIRMSFSFELLAQEDRARAGLFRTPHGDVETPAFMAVGTLATVKALDPEELVAMGAQMILANAYHLHLRPGDALIRDLGGLHRFMGWSRSILTDSGGFQVFSLAGLRTVDEKGVEFRSHIDGSTHVFTPESVMEIERNLGADVIMQFDHVIPGQSELAAARDASERSIRWLERCVAARAAQPDAGGLPQALFPIVQGGIHESLRREAIRAI